MTDRATCWSITINNPIESDYQIVLPAHWKLQGQLEKGELNGTLHYQGMLKTPQVRFSAVKRVFPKAHIEVARNESALKKYVNKEDTRVASVQNIPTVFEYQGIIADKWDQNEYEKRWQRAITNGGVPNPDDVAMIYLDDLVAQDIESGRRGAEFIAINPMWRSSWKRFWRSIIKRNGSYVSQAANAASSGGYAEAGAASPNGDESNPLVQGDLSVPDNFECAAYDGECSGSEFQFEYDHELRQLQRDV